MTTEQLQPGRQSNSIQFYRFPYLKEIFIATNPEFAIMDIYELWKAILVDHNSAAIFLQTLVDRSRSVGLQVSVLIENLEFSLPENHRLTFAIQSLQNVEHVYFTPSTANTSSIQGLFALFGKNSPEH